MEKNSSLSAKQSDRKPLSDVGSADKRAGRLNNVALVTDSELLHFGIDYMRLCLGKEENCYSPCLNFLNTLFSLPHNDTNASTYKNFVWADSDEDLDLTFGNSTHGEVCYIASNGWTIFSIEKLSEESSFYKNIHGKYQFVVSFYGDFFALSKLGLSLDTFLHLFREDIEQGFVVHTVSRLDVCCDWSELNVQDIASGIIVHSPKHAKPFTTLHTDWKTGVPETYYYGKPKDKRWHVRIYNKNKDNVAKGKEALYPQYWGLETVTRMELELREVCREFHIDFLNCWDTEFLLSICNKLLDTKYVQWKITPLLLRKMKEKEYDFFSLQRAEPDYNKLPNLVFYKNTLSKNLACVERLRIPLDTYLDRLRTDLQRELLTTE